MLSNPVPRPADEATPSSALSGERSAHRDGNTQHAASDEEHSRTAGTVTPDASSLVTASYRPGDVLDEKYKLEALLGQGGMGTVWRAKNLLLDAEVAIKVIRSRATSATSRDRLLREARVAAKLPDAAIVKVFDFGTSSFGDPYIVMELLEGETLEAGIHGRGRLSPRRAVRVLLPVIRALCLAHAAGIVHRDLKPENVFLVREAAGLKPKVVDFGVAKFDEAASPRLTTPGVLIGSPVYMAPEQAMGHPVDSRADIWAIAVVLYETLTGRVPFPGKNYQAVLHAVLFDAPENLAATGEIDPALWAILERALVKDVSARTASMRELGVSLAQWLIAQGVREDIAGGSIEKQWLMDGDADHLVTVMPPASDVGSSADSREWSSGERASLRTVARAPTPVEAPAPVRPRRWPLVLGAAAAAIAALIAVSLLRGEAPPPAPTAERLPAAAGARRAVERSARRAAAANDAVEPVTASRAAVPVRAPAPAAPPPFAAANADAEPEAAAPARSPAAEAAPIAQRPARVRGSVRRSKLRDPFAR